MHEVLVNRLGGLSLPRKSVVTLADHLNMTLDVYHGRKTTIQQQQPYYMFCRKKLIAFLPASVIGAYFSLEMNYRDHLFFPKN